MSYIWQRCEKTHLLIFTFIQNYIYEFHKTSSLHLSSFRHQNILHLYFFPNDTVISAVFVRPVSKAIKIPREYSYFLNLEKEVGMWVAWNEFFVSLGYIIRKKLELERRSCVSIPVWFRCRYLLSYIAFRPIARGNV